MTRPSARVGGPKGWPWKAGRAVAAAVVAIATLLAVLFAAGSRVSAQDDRTPAAAPRFTWVDVFVDSGARPLAAYQVEVKAAGASVGRVKIVGIEGGDPAAYSKPPYYDPVAMQGERVVIGAFSTGPAGTLPSGRVRVARVHVMFDGAGAPELVAAVQAAAGADESKLDITAAVEPGGTK